MSYDRIVSTDVRDVMHCLCLMQPLGVPMQLIMQVLGTEQEKADDLKLAECIGELYSTWGIVSMDAQEDPIVHRLVRAYIEHRLQESPGNYERFTNLVASALDHMTTQALNQPRLPEKKKNEKEEEKKEKKLTKILPHGEALCKGDAINHGQATHILCNLGRIREMLGNKEMAANDLKLAVEKAIDTDDNLLQAKAESYLGVSYFHMGRFAESVEVLASSQLIYQKYYEDGDLGVDDLHAYGTCLDYIGENYREQGDYENAHKLHNSAIAVAQSARDRRLRSLEAHATAQIGAIHLRQKQYDKTIDE